MPLFLGIKPFFHRFRNQNKEQNKRSSKPNNNKDTLKDTTIDSMETSYKALNINKKLNLSQSIQIGTLNTIEEKYDKYKNLEMKYIKEMNYGLN